MAILSQKSTAVLSQARIRFLYLFPSQSLTRGMQLLSLMQSNESPLMELRMANIFKATYEKECISKRKEGTLLGELNVLYLDDSAGCTTFIPLNSLNYKLKIGVFYGKLTSAEPIKK